MAIDEEEDQESENEQETREPIKSKEMQDAESDGETNISNKDLLKYMMHMANTLETNQKKLEEGLQSTIKTTVTKEVKAKTKELKTSLAQYLSSEMTDLKIQVEDSGFNSQQKTYSHPGNNQCSAHCC